MLNRIFQGIFDNSSVEVIPITEFLLCMGVSLLIGLFLAAVYTYKSRYTRSFVVTLALLPAVVCAVIMMVNGNIGAGVAVAGAFSLVRFRSAPGTAREIGTLFLAMAAGLIAGMGYLAYALLFSMVLGLILLLYQRVGLGALKHGDRDKILRITIPEDLDYSHVFDDLMERYTHTCEVVSVKTVNMGSMFKLTYHLVLKNLSEEKAFLDALRCRNGNLEISMSRQEVNEYEL